MSKNCFLVVPLTEAGPDLEHLKKDLLSATISAPKEEKPAEEKPVQVKDSQQARAESKEERRRRKEIEKLENEIADLDYKISEIEQQLSSPVSAEEVERLSGEYSRLKEERDAKLEKWMEISG